LVSLCRSFPNLVDPGQALDHCNARGQAHRIGDRLLAKATLHGWRLDTLIEVVVLLAGELVTNAITHTP
jgi:hypothetical protein